MFLVLFKENLQNVNKAVALALVDNFRKTLNDHFSQYANRVLNCQDQTLSFLYGSRDARFNPEKDLSLKFLKNGNKSILLGECADVEVSFPFAKNSQNCTENENYAQKLSSEFAIKKADLYAELTEKFLLVGIDGDAKCIHVATNPLSSNTIYWVDDDSQIFVSTDINLIKYLTNKELQLSERGLASWLSGYPNPEISLFAGINVLPIGHRLELSPTKKAKTVKFWDIDPDEKITMENQDDYSAQFFSLLNSSVANACKSTQNVVASQMSGGLDSTSITALAKENLQKVGKSVLPVSHLYTQSKKSDESQLVKDMLAHLKIDEHIKMPVDEGKNRDFLALYPSDIESPGTVLSPRYVKELALIKRANADVMLTGNGGDELCWGHSSAYTQRLKSGEVGVISEVIQACRKIGMPKRQTLTQLFIKPYLPEMLVKMLSKQKARSGEQVLPIWLTDKSRAMAIEETAINNPFNLKLDPVGYHRYHSLKTTSTYNAVRSYEKVAQGFGISVRHPFFDPALAKYSFAIPAKQLIQGPYPKWLLRHSMQSHLPNSVCWNLKKTTFDQHFGNLVKENAQALRSLLQDERLAEMGLVNHTLLLREFDQVVSNPDAALNVDMLYAILTYSWLRTHFPNW